MSKCSACNNGFKWDDIVVIVSDKTYHRWCLNLYPTGFYAMLDGDILGETENEDGQMACEIVDCLPDD